MDTAKQAVEVIQSAERKLRDFVAVAAGNGDYDSAARIMDWAKSLAELTAQPTSTNTSISETVERSLRTKGARSRRRPPKGAYPRFFRRGDNLVKIGWSRKEGEEYEHKAPRRVVDALAEAIARRSNNGKVFKAEDLFPLKDPQDGSDVPGYQGYVALAWFKSAGLVKKHGRRGYTVVRPERLRVDSQSSWAAIAANA